MFTGLIERTGMVSRVLKENSGVTLVITANFAENNIQTGESIAINGVCLTVTRIEQNDYYFYISFKTIELTNLGKLQAGNIVNLERAMKLSDRLGGHLVSGHVDCIGEIIEINPKEQNVIQFTLKIPDNYGKYLLPRGSICVDGISLTIVNVDGNQIELVIIPETIAVTNVNTWKIGYTPNIEFDMMIRYVESLLKFR